MPLPKLNGPEIQSPPIGTEPPSHYFDQAHGDVASLHSRIEQGFGQYSFEHPPRAILNSRIETAIRGTSRAAGVVGLIGAMGMIAYIFI